MRIATVATVGPRWAGVCEKSHKMRGMMPSEQCSAQLIPNQNAWTLRRARRALFGTPLVANRRERLRTVPVLRLPVDGAQAHPTFNNKKGRREGRPFRNDNGWELTFTRLDRRSPQDGQAVLWRGLLARARQRAHPTRLPSASENKQRQPVPTLYSSEQYSCKIPFPGLTIVMHSGFFLL